MNLKEEITTEASRRFPASGYGQDDLLDIAFEYFDKRLTSMIITLHNEWKQPPEREMIPWNDMYATLISTFLEFKASYKK